MKPHLLLILLNLSTLCYSQPYIDNNEIGIRTSFYSFFKEKHKNINYKESILWNPRSFGITYKRKIKNKNYISLEIDNYRLFKSYDVEYEKYDVVRRQMINFRFSYLNRILQKNRHDLFLTGSLNYRIGSEHLFFGNFVGGTVNETKTIFKEFNDLGVSIGSRYNFHLSQSFFLHSEISFTNHFIKKGQIDPLLIDDPGTTRNMMFFSFGFGFNFGN